MTLPRNWNWKILGAAGAMLAVGVWVQRAAWAEIWNIAERDPESGHIFLVPIVVAYLVWVRAAQVRLIVPKPSWIGPAIVVVGCLTGLAGQNWAFQSLEHAGAVLVTMGCVLSVLGWDVLVNFLPAFGALAFLIPVPPSFRQAIAIPLEHVTAILTQEIFDVLGVAVERSGNLLAINGISVTVAEACNGLRMVLSLALVSYLYAFGTPLKGYVRAIVILASPISAIACNIVRLVPTVWFFGNSTKPVAEQMHEASGWVMLVIALLALMGIVGVLKWARVPVARFMAVQ